MTEASLTQDLFLDIKTLMPHGVTLKHSDRFSSGRPDFSHTWRDLTSWWEVKFWDNGPFESPELQHITCRRLAAMGVCHYIIYERRHELRRVVIVHPERLQSWETEGISIFGFNHLAVARFIARTHHFRTRTVNVC